MKQSTKRTVFGLVATLFMILGGMLLSSESHAQIQETKAAFTNPAPGGKSWVTNGQALQSVQAEILLLTSQLNLLIQQGADEALIGKKKTELQYYIVIEQLLNAGNHVSYVVYEALKYVGGEVLADDSATVHPYMSKDDFQAMLDKAITKLTK